MTDEELKMKLRGVADYLAVHVWMLSSNRQYLRALRREPAFVDDDFFDGLLSFWHQYRGESLRTPEGMLEFCRHTDLEEFKRAEQALNSALSLKDEAEIVRDEKHAQSAMTRRLSLSPAGN